MATFTSYMCIPGGQSTWKGPFKVVEGFAETVYKIKGYQCVHFDRVKLYIGENKESNSGAPPTKWLLQLPPNALPPNNPVCVQDGIVR